jgi:uncharacterized protein
MSVLESISILSPDPAVRGVLHRPLTPSGKILVLTHGAGGNAQSGLLVSLAEMFAGRGFAVLRCDLPFRQIRRFGPPRPADAPADRQGLANAVLAMRKQYSGPAFLGGQSYGGRQASMLCADESLVEGLLLLSYPLHPPSRPDRPRTEHLPKVRIPVMFVHGTRDPFGSIDEIEAARKLISARTLLLPVEGAGHDLGFKQRFRREDLPATVMTRFLEFFDQPAG